MHATQACATCHVNNVYKGTPRDCVGCHLTIYDRDDDTAPRGGRLPDAPATRATADRRAAGQGATFNHNSVFALVGRPCHAGLHGVPREQRLQGHAARLRRLPSDALRPHDDAESRGGRFPDDVRLLSQGDRRDLGAGHVHAHVPDHSGRHNRRAPRATPRRTIPDVQVPDYATAPRDSTVIIAAGPATSTSPTRVTPVTPTEGRADASQTCARRPGPTVADAMGRARGSGAGILGCGVEAATVEPRLLLHEQLADHRRQWRQPLVCRAQHGVFLSTAGDRRRRRRLWHRRAIRNLSRRLASCACFPLRSVRRRQARGRSGAVQSRPRLAQRPGLARLAGRRPGRVPPAPGDTRERASVPGPSPASSRTSSTPGTRPTSRNTAPMPDSTAPTRGGIPSATSWSETAR